MTEKHDGLRWLGEMDQAEVDKEDFEAKGKGKYTIEGVDPNDPEWLKKASEKVHPAKGDDYVELDCGLLTVNQLNWMLKKTFGELTFCDENHQLMWYNRKHDGRRMLAKRKPEQVGNTMDDVHPHVGNVIKYAKQVWYGLRNKYEDHDELWVPVAKYHGAPITHYERYKRIEDDEGNFRGIFEYVVDLKPIVDYYLKTNGLKAVPLENCERPDHVTSPGDIEREKRLNPEKVDTSTGASQS